MAVILLVYLILGMGTDALAMMIITIPIFFPAIMALGLTLYGSGLSWLS